MHTHIQLDPDATVSLRTSDSGIVEIVILDAKSDCSTVLELTSQQVAAICEAASVQ